MTRTQTARARRLNVRTERPAIPRELALSATVAAPANALPVKLPNLRTATAALSFALKGESL